MDQFFQNETPNYDHRYEIETLSNQIESYDNYFNDSFDDQLLNIKIPTATTDYNKLLHDRRLKVDSQMIFDSINFLPSHTPESISLSDDNGDHLEIFLSTQP
uniref:Uncharacterized protein n=1 Tax=Glossina austeni TaxID=7395 RepID=A0A1A9UD00_GLOAU